VHQWQIECNVSLFICLSNSKELENAMLHKGDDPRLTASHHQVDATGAYSLAC